jgi:NIMA-interacting peptidyl-prolyl cis-trans isomerase 1
MVSSSTETQLILSYLLSTQSSDWEICMSKSKGIPYYFNPTTKQSSWDVPAEISEEQIQSLPGAHYLSGGSSGGAGTITASHLLVKHKDSRRPSSWKEVCMQLPGHT